MADGTSTSPTALAAGASAGIGADVARRPARAVIARSGKPAGQPRSGGQTPRLPAPGAAGQVSGSDWQARIVTQNDTDGAMTPGAARALRKSALAGTSGAIHEWCCVVAIRT